jgi:hypothetical protein
MRVELLRIGPRVWVAIVTVALVAACGPGDHGSGEGGASGMAVVKGDGGAAGDRTGEAAPAKAGAEDAEMLAEGKVAWRSCAKCHCATDPRIAEDEDWVRLNEETTCIESGKPVPRLRAAIMAYLRDRDTLRPSLLARDHAPADGEKAGKVAVPEIGGSAYLKADRESIRNGSPAMVRLRWDETPDEKSIPAPAGKYDVINFWFYRRARGSEEQRWMVSGTNVSGCATLDIKPGGEEVLVLEPTLYGELVATRKDDGYALSFSMHDLGGSRMTLSRNGRVVMPRFRISDAQGKTVAEGPFGIS